MTETMSDQTPGLGASIVRGGAVLLLILCSGIVAAWVAGRVVTDRYGWSQWLFWIPTPAVILMCSIGFLAFLAPARTKAGRCRTTTLWATMSLLIAGQFLFVEHAFHRIGGGRFDGIRIVNWNLSHPTPREREAYADVVARLAGDVIVLSSPSAVVWEDQVVEQLDEGVAAYPLGMFVVLSRYALIGARHVPVDFDGAWVTFVELDARDDFGRTLLICIVDLPSDPSLPRSGIARAVRAGIEKAGMPKPDLVVGDFNMTRGGEAIASMFPQHRSAFEEAGRGYGATFPRTAPLYHIDHVLLGAGTHALAYEIIDPGIGRHMAQAVILEAEG